MSLPVSINALRTLVAVSAAGSMANAAARLGVTPGAVSQAVRQLERSLGRELVRARGRNIALTEEGAALCEAIGPSFDRIDQALDDFVKERRNQRMICITTTPSFAATWLVPRLTSLSSAFPGWRIEINAAVELKNLTSATLTIAIRHGAGRYPGHRVVHLHQPSLIVVARPDIAASAGPDPREWLKRSLLHDRDQRNWEAFAKEIGVEAVDARRVSGPLFENDALLIEAAASGGGLALVRDIYAAHALGRGRIVRLGTTTLTTDAAYYFVAAPSRVHGATTTALQKWFERELD